MILVGIIDYGAGNINSVFNAFTSLQCPVEVVQDPLRLAACTHLVLPGVGAFKDGMAKLSSRGWIAPLTEEVLNRRKSFLGICLGMQLLATEGTEHGRCEGLNWIPGIVKQLPETPSERIPHIGWDDVQHVRAEGLYAGGGLGAVYYFVHSYALYPKDSSVISGVCEYGQPFVASVERDNISATQFHPEKSQKAGLQLLRKFIERGSS